MTTSMTGFGTFRAEDDNMILDVQVKSVNGRFFEPRFRMPREYSPLENELKKILSKQLLRGTVDININKSVKASDKPISVTVNTQLAQSWIKATEELAKKFNLESHLTVENLTRVPDVVQFDQKSELEDSEKKLLFKALEGALAQCLSEKRREGQGQVQTLSQLLDELENFVNTIKKKKVIVDQELQSKLQERLKALKEDAVIDQNRLSQEVLFLLDRADIAEEIERASTHIQAFRGALKLPPPTGKKLEFYTQELHREVNTMGAKTQNLGVTLDIIEAKTTVERLREQVQNVE